LSKIGKLKYELSKSFFQYKNDVFNEYLIESGIDKFKERIKRF
jgi:hypothetical protein